MKTKTSIWIKLVLLVFILLSISGVMEDQAFAFLTEVAKKNSGFLLAVSEINMIVSGITSVNIPFVSGSTAGLESSLDKVQNYLLLTDTISFLQLMLVSISKSWIFKGILLGLFIFTLLEKRYKFFLKLLVFALALSPGLSIYTVTMSKIAQTASIDYGDKYLGELKATVQSVLEENTRLNQQHEKNLTQIENGSKGVEVLRRLREDISYDLKKTGNTLSGDFTEIRTLIKSAGHEMTVKISRFCTMLLFSLLILPVGYALIIYMLFKTFFSRLVLAHEVGINYSPTPPAQGNTKRKKSIFQKLFTIFNTIKNELQNAEGKLDLSNLKKDVQHAAQKVEQPETPEASTTAQTPANPSTQEVTRSAPSVPATATNTPPQTATPPVVEQAASPETTDTDAAQEPSEKGAAASPEKEAGSEESRKPMKRSPGSILGV